jgi:hypothetical protein
MKLQKDKIPFTMVANEVLNHAGISLKAKGLYAYLFSKPEGWNFSSKRIVNDCKESRPTILAALQELEANGLLVRRKRNDGRMDYLLTFSSSVSQGQESLPSAGSKKPNVKEPHVGISCPISNTETESNKEKHSNTDKSPARTAQEQKQIADVVEAFKIVNPSYKLLFARKPQHEAAFRLILAHGFERLLGMIAYLQQSNAIRYAPTITTPIQLEEKMGELKAWADKQRSQSRGKGIISATSPA